jgi:arylsulfatase
LYDPEDAPASSLTEWTSGNLITGMPESAAPNCGKVSSVVTIDIDAPKDANGVLYALAGFSNGIAGNVKDVAL